MGRKNKKVIARILAVVMAFTLLPFDLWGSANVVMAEELSDVCLEEATGAEDDMVLEDVTDAQEIVENVTDTRGEQIDDVLEDEENDFEFVDADERVEDDKGVEVKERQNETEIVSGETDNKDAVVHIHNFTGADGNYTITSDYFTIAGNEKSNAPTTVYNGLTLTKAIKLESNVISFNAASKGILTLVFLNGSTGGKKIKVDDVPYTADSKGVAAIELEAGEHKITKGDSANLYYISFEETGAPKQIVATPTANPANGEITVDSKIQLLCETDNATIHYTTDGSDPKESESTSTHIGTEITVTSSMVIDNKVTIRAYATKEGCTDSECASFEYTVTKAVDQLAEPVATPDPKDGAVARGTKVTLESNEDGASIYYTTDGTDPSVSNEMLYKDPIEITEEMTIKAIAAKENFTTSFPASFTYTIKKPTIKVNDDNFSKSVISKVELNGDVIFTNGTKEVFDISLKTVENTNPDNNVKAIAEGLKENDGEIIYYDFSLVNNENTSDTVSIADNSEGTLKIEMPYSIMPDVGKRNGIAVVNAATGEIETSKDWSGFIFDADSVGTYAVVINPVGETGGIAILESAGYEEGAYAEWEAVQGADGYMAYVASAGGEFTRIDDELIRKYDDYWRVDTVGLKKGTYYIKVNAVVLDKKDGETTATVIATNTTKALNVVSHDRSGYAWVNGTSSGAYNEDGTLKSNANVIYVTEATKDTVTLDVVTSSKGAITSCEGVIAILAGYKKGYEKTPLVLRFIGNITDFEGIDADKDCKGDIVVDGNNAGVTIEGIGEDTVANGWGIRLKNASNVEIRNLAFMNCNSDEGDNIGLQQNNDHVWVHHCDMFYGDAGTDKDQVKGDGALDCKESTYATFSYNHFWDSGKCNLAGLSKETTDMYITYHHNWYDHSDSRHPRIRFFTTHVYNNYYDGNAKYGVGAALGGPSVFVENNYFRNCPYPMLISMQGSDVWDGSKNKNDYANNSTFSKEDGGIIKAYGNIMEGVKRFIPYSATDDPATAWDESVDFDAYVVQNRNDIVPSTVKTVSGVSGLKGSGNNTYSNFDTAPDFYDYVPDDAKDVPAIVMARAGRVNGGDFKWEFDDAVEDSNYTVINELKTAIVNYKSSIKAIGGGVAGEVTVMEDDSSNAPDEDFQMVNAPEADKAAGLVDIGTKITLTTTTSGAEIYYTINSTAPTKNSTHYTEPIVIEKDTIIRAIAILGNSTSDVSIFKYTVPGGTGGDNPGGDNSGENNQPENTTIVKYEFNPELIGFNLTDTETDSSGTVKQIYKMPADDTVYGDYFTIGNNSARSGKIAKTSTSGKTLAAPNPSKSDVTGYNVRYQFSGTADDPRAIRFTTKNKARVSVAAYRVNDNVRDLYLDTDDNVKTLTRTAAEYTFDIVEAGSHSVYAKDGDIAILYVIVEEFVPITDDNVEVKEPYSMLSQGEVPKGTSVELKCDTTGAIIYFTTDGTGPTEESTVYTSPIPLGNEAKQVVIKAIAVKDNVKSEVVSFTYTVSADIDPDTFVSAPVSDVASGKVSKGTKVTLTSATTDAKIYYTTDGTDPTPRDELLYKAPIVINEAVTIKAISVKGENTSSVVSFVYTISAETSGGDTQNIAAPKAIPGDGAQFPSTGGSVELACDTDGATIYYTMSSTENGLTDPADDENTERKEYNNTPIPIKEETYIWAVAVKDGAVSEALKCHYIVLAEGAVVQPTATPGSSEVASGTKIELSTTEPVDNIYYTMGSTPAATADPTLENSGRIVYDAKTQIVITEAVTIKAVAQKGGKYSDVATFTYTVVSGGTENPGDPEVKTIKLEECEITVPAIIRSTSKKADANQPSVTYVTYKYTDGSGEEKHVKFAEGEYLDYKVMWNGAVEGKENTYSVTLTGLGREEDQFKIDTASTITKEYKVIDKPGKDSTVKVIDISKAKVNLAATDIKNVVYTGYAIEPKLDYSKDKDNLAGKLNIAYKNNVNAGKATVIISAKPELNDENTIYIGSKTLTFNIKKAALNKDNAKATAKVCWDDSFSMTSGHDYTGTPVVVEGLKVESGKGRTLGLNTDYTVTYKNNARAGKATVTVKGIGNNLSGSWTQNFTINPVDLKTLTFNEKELPYSPKGAKLAAITAKNAAGDVYTLKEGVDYTAKYTYASKTKEAGSKVTVSISGKGACTGKDIEIGELDIVKGNFAECITVPEDIAVDGKDLAKELAKAIVVTDASGVKLVVNKDYTIETSDKGSKTVTINPVDTKNYENACSVPYRVAINLAKDKGFVFDKNKEKNAPLAYDGRNPVMLTADIINEYVGSAYQLGKNIEIVPGTYKNNTKKGTAQVTVRGKAGVDAGFYGQKVLKFKIVEK